MDFSFLSNTSLFHGIRPEEIQGMLACLGIYEKTCPKNSVICRAGDQLSDMGLVEEGSANIVVNTYWGVSSILGHISKGETFGEAYAAIPGQELLCDVTACEDCRILFLPMGRALTQCQSSCGFHSRLIYNLVRISAAKISVYPTG